MRIDHHAYQRAVVIAAFGLGLQVLIGTALLVFGLSAHDTTTVYSSLYVLTGVIVWIGLILVFHQHRMERLEALEEDEITAAAAGVSTIFDAAGDEVRVAARRLRLMYRWLMPSLSVLLILLLVGWAWRMLTALGQIEAGDRPFILTDHRGWQISMCLAFAVVSFIFSRFVAGMAAQPAWQNLRAGASYVVGNTLILVAMAAGVGFRFISPDSHEVIKIVAWAIPIFMIALALEIAMNLVLNAYRPRMAGETPRPAFDSKTLSLFAAPDSLVKSLNEAVNYQFGFDITSSWGYKLLIRSSVWLVALGAGVLLILSTMIVVEPSEVALRLSHGRIVGEDDGAVRGAGLHWKMPWPIESSALYDVTRIQTLPLTAPESRPRSMYLFGDDLEDSLVGRLDPFIVGASQLGRSGGASVPEIGGDAEAMFSDVHALVEALLSLEYRVKDTPAGALASIQFADQTGRGRSSFSTTQGILRDLAMSEVTKYFSELTLNSVLSGQRADLAAELQRRIQRAYDEHDTGIEIVTVNIPFVKPPGFAAESFEQLGMSTQGREQLVASAERRVAQSVNYAIGDMAIVDELTTAIQRFNEATQAVVDLEADGADADTIAAARATEHDTKVEATRLLIAGNGALALGVAGAQRDRWLEIMAKRAQASQVLGQSAAFRAAPDLYRQRAVMDALVRNLQITRKFVIGVDPSRLDVNYELRELSNILNFSDAIDTEGNP